MPCEMDNQPGGVRLYISADDSEMDNQAGGEIQYLEGQIRGLTPNSYQEGGRSWIHIKWEHHKISARCQTCFNQILAFKILQIFADRVRHYHDPLHAFFFLQRFQ